MWAKMQAEAGDEVESKPDIPPSGETRSDSVDRTNGHPTASGVRGALVGRGNAGRTSMLRRNANDHTRRSTRFPRAGRPWPADGEIDSDYALLLS